MSLQTTRNQRYLLLCILLAAALYVPLRALGSLSLSDNRYSHIILIPIVSISVIYLERNSIFRQCQYCASVGVPLLLVGIALCYGGATGVIEVDRTYDIVIASAGFVLIWISGFVLCYGMQTCRKASFALLLLFLMVPVPPGVLERATVALQKGSAEVSYILFKVTGVPFLRDGFRFALPGVDIEIAEQCSGIRSSIALCIASLLAGHVFLQSSWRKLGLVLVTIPIVIFKNAVRIVTITYLGVYVDRGFLHGTLHRYSGLPFSLLAVALLVCALIILQKPDYRLRKATPTDAADTMA